MEIIRSELRGRGRLCVSYSRNKNAAFFGPVAIGNALNKKEKNSNLGDFLIFQDNGVVNQMNIYLAPFSYRVRKNIA